MKNIVLFASGSGSNVENIYRSFKEHPSIRVKHVFCNNPNALVIQRCSTLGIDCTVFNREDFYHSTKVLDLLSSLQPDLIVLAGFLWLIPSYLVKAYPDKIINIHPALLPKYGGKGMFGKHVHQAVVDNKESKSGITIHYVNENYDDGNVILQEECTVLPSDSAEEVAQKVHQLEYRFFPISIEKLLEPK